jgi:hypothetical protein
MNKAAIHKNEKEHGAVLVITLLVIVVLALAAVAFMQNTSAERQTARSQGSQYRAQLAAEAGLADFQAMLARLTATNDFVVVALTNGITNVTALVEPLTNGQVRVFPLFSRSNNTNGLLAASPFNSSQLLLAANSVGTTTNLNPTFNRYGGIEWPATNANALVLGAQFVFTSTNKNGTPAAQFAYVVADDCAKLNLDFMGLNYTNGGRTNPVPFGFPGEVAVHSVGTNTLAAADHNRFKTLPEDLLTGVMLSSVFASTNDRKNKSRFYSSHKGQALDLIPAGHFDDARSNFTAHIDAGKFKYDLNRMATNSANSTSNAFLIADVISSNLPNFRLRDPSFTANTLKPSDTNSRYARRIAAALVDYIDPDATPTSITDGEPAGKEATPYTFQVAERYDWVSTVPGTSSTSWRVTIRQKLFVELWNPYTVPVSGDFKFELETFRKIEPTGGSTVNIPKLSKNINVSLQPNEIKVFEVGEQNVVFDVTGSDPSMNPSTTPLIFSQTHSSDVSKPKHSAFRAYWNNALYDQNSSYNTALFDQGSSGLERDSLTMTNANRLDRPSWAVNTGPTPASAIYRAVNDPRQNHINSYVWESMSYTNASVRWNGASDWPTNSTRTHKFETTWANRDGFRAALNIGNSVSATADPTTAATTYNISDQANNAPAYIKNGAMETVAELGHIYDPVHLDDAGINTQKTTDPKSYYASGGGRTLRIGQPEPTNHATLNLSGQRAMNLLDIFTALPAGVASNGVRASGLNINTAPLDVLAAFFYNLQPVSDEGVANGSKISLMGATNVATNIIANRPYYSASDMHRFLNELANNRANYSPPIAGVPALGSGTPNMHDRAREELFRRAYNSLDTKSGAFRFYGVGRSLSPSGMVDSTAVLEAWVELRAATNNITGQVFLQPVVTQRKFL